MTIVPFRTIPSLLQSFLRTLSLPIDLAVFLVILLGAISDLMYQRLVRNSQSYDISTQENRSSEWTAMIEQAGRKWKSEHIFKLLKFQY